MTLTSHQPRAQSRNPALVYPLGLYREPQDNPCGVSYYPSMEVAAIQSADKTKPGGSSKNDSHHLEPTHSTELSRRHFTCVFSLHLAMNWGVLFFCERLLKLYWQHVKGSSFPVFPLIPGM